MGTTTSGGLERLSRRGLIVAGAGLVAGCATASSGPGTAQRRSTPSPLPTPSLGDPVTLRAALARRHSVRSFGPEPLSLAELGQLFWAAQGVTHGPGYRTAPSAGALYPLELYAATRTVTWHYLPAGHQVEQWSPAQSWPFLVGTTVSQAAVRTAPVVFVLTGVLGRTRPKYGERARQYLLLEAGHAAQNLLLQAVALGLGAVTIGGFNDDAVTRYLAANADETPLYLIPTGHPST